MTRKSFGYSASDIERLFEEAEEARQMYLRNHEWGFSSSYPDCMWRWSKRVKGELITTCHSEEAFYLELDIQQFAVTQNSE